jgi:hypothetical protein
MSESAEPSAARTNILASLVAQDGLHPRGYMIRSRGGVGGWTEEGFGSLLTATERAKELHRAEGLICRRDVALFVPGINHWLAFVVLADGFARCDSLDMDFDRAAATATE